MDYSEVKLWNFTQSSFSVVRDCRTKHRTEVDVSKTRALSGRHMDNSSIKLTKAVCFWTSVICQSYVSQSYVSHIAGELYWACFHTVDHPGFEKKRIRLRVRPCYLLQSRLSKDERSYHPLAVSFPSSFYSESHTSLQILMRWKCSSTTLCPRSLEKPLTCGFWIEWRGRSTVPVRTRKLGITRRKSERALNFFFCSADRRKSMRAHNEKQRKKTCLAFSSYPALLSSSFSLDWWNIVSQANQQSFLRIEKRVAQKEAATIYLFHLFDIKEKRCVPGGPRECSTRMELLNCKRQTGDATNRPYSRLQLRLFPRVRSAVYFRVVIRCFRPS